MRDNPLRRFIALLCAAFISLVIAGPVAAQGSKGQPQPLPLEYSATGVLFRIKAPGAQSVYVAGTFNGWGDSDGNTVSDPASKMFGPDEDGIFEFFAPLTPGTHVFKYAVNGNQWMPGPADLPRRKDDFDLLAGQNNMQGSAFDFSLQEPPWPSYVPTNEMMPQVFTHQETGQPYLRVRFFSRQATTAHIVGNWNGWAHIDYRKVRAPEAQLSPTRVPNVWERYIGPLNEGFLEYKIVANNRMWLSDPSVVETSQDGNTMMRIVKGPQGWYASYTPRFDPKVTRKDTKRRWGSTLSWEDDRNNGFAQAQLTRQRMLWVITLPKSKMSDDLMRSINSDPELVNQLQNFICLETSANEVNDIIRSQKIVRLPYVILVDSTYKPSWQKFNPSPADLKEALKNLK